MTTNGLLAGVIEFSENIEAITANPDMSNGPYILPGFIDVHVHGGGGGDTMDGVGGIETMAKFHLKHGTTSIYPTTITNPWQKIMAALKAVKEVQKSNDQELPSIMGAHLEGPFISPNRLGAQPPFTVEPAADLVKEVLGLDVVRLLTIAPELDTAMEAAKSFAKAGVRVSVGHSVASYEEVQLLLDAVAAVGGASSFTHLYNAMGGLMGRRPAIVGAAFANRESYAELIFDTHHVHSAAMMAAFNVKREKLLFITDAIRATGLKEGKSELGGQAVLVKDGMAKLSDGTLAGSVLTMDAALRNGLEHNLTLTQVSKMLSSVPARYMGLKDRGELKEGLRADLVLMDKDFKILEVYVGGRRIIG